MLGRCPTRYQVEPRGAIPGPNTIGEMLKAEDIAACIYYCLTQPRRCDVVAVSIRPHRQEI